MIHRNRKLRNYWSYSIDMGVSEQAEELHFEDAMKKFDKQVKIAELMLAKNHDYGEAWRDMRVIL